MRVFLKQDKLSEVAQTLRYLYSIAFYEWVRPMIRFRLKERITDLSFKTGRKVTLDEVAAGTGIHRATLSKIGTKKGYNFSTDVVD